MLADEHGIPTVGITNTEFFERLHDRLSQNEFAEADAEQAAAMDSEWDDFMRLTRADSPEQLDEAYGGPRTLEDLENEYRQEADSGTAGDRATGDERPGPGAAGAGGGEEGVPPVDGGAGDGGRGNAGEGEGGNAGGVTPPTAVERPPRTGAERPSYWMNEGEIDEAIDRWRGDPLLGPVARWLGHTATWSTRNPTAGRTGAVWSPRR
jgi:hypothetical protein